MRAATTAGVVAFVLAVLSGCGSSHAGGGASTSAKTTGSSGRSGSTSSAGIRIDTTPKFVAPSAGAPVRSGVVAIAMRYITLSPDAIRVKVGSRIKWTNYDNIQHNVTSVNGPQRLHSGNFGQGGSYEVKLTRPGVIHYLCTNHPATMNGTIAVVR